MNAGECFYCERTNELEKKEWNKDKTNALEIECFLKKIMPQIFVNNTNAVGDSYHKVTFCIKLHIAFEKIYS